MFWTVNDGGNPSAIYAVTRTGELVAEVSVEASNVDWEDLAIEGDRLYIADIGNNTARRREVQVYELPEPNPRPATAAEVPPRPVRPGRQWTLTYPDERPFDAEAFFTLGGRGYVISKQRDMREAVLCTFDLDGERPRQAMRRIGTLPIRAPVTAADVSADGRWLVALTVAGPRVMRIDGDIGKAATATPLAITFVHPHMEAACAVDEGVLATTEGRQVLLFTWEQLHRGGVVGPPPTPRP